jgi:hypothetical protein
VEALSKLDHQIVSYGIFFPVEWIVALHRLCKLAFHEVFHVYDVHLSSGNPSHMGSTGPLPAGD